MAQQAPKTDISGEEPWVRNSNLQEQLSKNEGGNDRVSLFGPLFLWALIIIIGIILEVIMPAILGKVLASYAAAYKTAGNYILTLPGAIILPLIISVWIGHKVGEIAKNAVSAVKLGLINGVYASIVYGVIIFVAQLTLKYTTTYALTTDFIIKYLIGIPIAIVIVFTIIIALLNEMRH